MTLPHAGQDPQNPQERPSLAGRIEGLVLIPNLIFVGFVVLYLVSLQANGKQVAPLVQGERSTEARIAELERQLGREPGSMGDALELARLYQQVGEFPWSYRALLDAEREGSDKPRWRMMLGLAYLELGKNDDAIRVLGSVDARCRKDAKLCDFNLRTKLSIFDQLAQTFKKRGIDSRKHHRAAEKALHEILKPVEVDPDKMRPKAPASPRPAPAGAKKKAPAKKG